jgi:hypothetical protein
MFVFHSLVLRRIEETLADSECKATYFHRGTQNYNCLAQSTLKFQWEIAVINIATDQGAKAHLENTFRYIRTNIAKILSYTTSTMGRDSAVGMTTLWAGLPGNRVWIPGSGK